FGALNRAHPVHARGPAVRPNRKSPSPCAGLDGLRPPHAAREVHALDTPWDTRSEGGLEAYLIDCRVRALDSDAQHRRSRYVHPGFSRRAVPTGNCDSIRVFSGWDIRIDE